MLHPRVRARRATSGSFVALSLIFLAGVSDAAPMRFVPAAASSAAPLEQGEVHAPDEPAFTPIPQQVRFFVDADLPAIDPALPAAGPYGEPPRVKARIADDALRVRIEFNDGYRIDTLVAEVPLAAGGTAEVSASWVPTGANEYFEPVPFAFNDVHGALWFTAGAEEGVQVTLRFDAVRLLGEACEPARFQGSFALDVPSGSLAGLASGDSDLGANPARDAERGHAFSPSQLDDSPTTLKYPDGTPRAQGLLDRAGRRQGKWKTWYPDGTEQSASTWVDGARSGAWSASRIDGTPDSKGELDGATRLGSWTETVHQDGLPLAFIGEYVSGKREGTWYANHVGGHGAIWGHFKDGQRDGPWTTHYPSGELRNQGWYKDGRQYGRWVWWNPDGSERFVEDLPLPR